MVSLIPKESVNSIPTMDKIMKVSTVVNKSSCWGTPCSPKIVMPLYWNKDVTTIESCLNESSDSIIAKSGINNSHTVATTTKVNIVGDKSSSWGTPWLTNSANISYPENRTSQTFLHQASHLCILINIHGNQGKIVGKCKFLGKKKKKTSS